jgi:quercetin dioxygenase-like cupin family protein
MNKFGKIWGFTSEIFTNDSVSIHRIEIDKNKKCSKHLHQYKYNTFFVESGKIVVHRWDGDGLISTVLDKHDTITISPNIYHQFEALENSIVYEIYFIQINNSDILRHQL